MPGSACGGTTAAPAATYAGAMSWWERMTRWEARHQFPIDLTMMLVTGVMVIPVSAAVAGGGINGLVGLFWSVAVWVPLGWRRRNPVGSVVAVYAAGLLHLVLGVPTFMPADIAVLIALYSVTVHGPRWAHRTAIACALAGSAVLAATLATVNVGADPVSLALAVTLIGGFCAACAVATWAFGLMRRARRETIVALMDRAERLEVERDQQATIAAAAERTRIAREMHDIVAHSLSVVVAQADGGRYAAAADPDAAVRALTTIGETGRAALADMRRLLGVLRQPVEPSGTRALSAADGVPGVRAPAPLGVGGAEVDEPAAPSTPQPAEHDLEQLVDQVRSSGVQASLVRMGTARALPPGMGLTVYRICQEALTNVLKHAGPEPTVTVLVQWRPSSLVLEITDDGRGAAATSDGAGHGLLGMRERAAMFGGTVSSGPRPGGGFRVRAELPLPTAS